MQMTDIQIIFPAIIEFDQFDTQTVTLGGIFPEIHITLINQASGLHEFAVKKSIDNTHPSCLNPAIAEAQTQINLFWNILSVVRDTLVQATGEVLYLYNQQKIVAIPRPRANRGPSLIGIAGNGWFTLHRNEFHKEYDLELLIRYNYCLLILEPIGKFVSLYALLLSFANDKQNAIDGLIKSVYPEVTMSTSPHTGKPGTIFTRLRNELAHRRSNTSIMKTHDEIKSNLDKFVDVVKTNLKNRIVIN